jgi:hypothetical protein
LPDTVPDVVTPVRVGHVGVVPLTDPVAPPIIEPVAVTVPEKELLLIDPAPNSLPTSPPILFEPVTVTDASISEKTPSALPATPPPVPWGELTVPLMVTPDTVALAATSPNAPPPNWADDNTLTFVKTTLLTEPDANSSPANAPAIWLDEKLMADTDGDVRVRFDTEPDRLPNRPMRR